ncbi:MAG: Hsp20/alpha crystallin family protein [Chloroflexi bacterium]|nr:Hsp20/alpha crystallin family protein [Chloroflexota bacterium]
MPRSEFDVGLDVGPGGAVRRWIVVRRPSVWQPPTDVYERADRLIVLVEIAGMRDQDFSVTLQGQQLIISGVRHLKAAPDCAYHQMEIRFGEFRTEVNLPRAVKRDEVSASYRDGFLRIELPFVQKQKIHIVNVNLEAEQSTDESVDESSDNSTL